MMRLKMVKIVYYHKKLSSSDITTFEIEKPGNWVVGQFQKNLVISIIVSVIFI